MARVASKPGPQCVVTIGLVDSLMLSAADGMKLVALLSKAVVADVTFEATGEGRYGNRIIDRGCPAVEFKLLTAKDVVISADATPFGRKKGAA